MNIIYYLHINKTKINSYVDLFSIYLYSTYILVFLKYHNLKSQRPFLDSHSFCYHLSVEPFFLSILLPLSDGFLSSRSVYLLTADDSYELLWSLGSCWQCCSSPSASSLWVWTVHVSSSPVLWREHKCWPLETNKTTVTEQINALKVS